ncbi:Oidioi.mRNA.OKI2018_I69.chr2.g6337.t1.cds [Oikopleura dioica]|uniref:Oidioi.mRNA.OKI2018_I69.chr2.g6337.t1.cds n=1 Tax=Oikopleura dioica TaxID=34765 RepID=A0ABN7T8T1_OIKDI|nr:Oidioi.mRNA.OKI2018_I69.chr2.g6337.t1.cds [Oikopleura dioica]
MKRKLDDEIVTFDLCVIGSSTKCSVQKNDLTTDWLLGKIEEITSKNDHRLVPSMQFISIWDGNDLLRPSFQILDDLDSSKDTSLCKRGFKSGMRIEVLPHAPPCDITEEEELDFVELLLSKDFFRALRDQFLRTRWDRQIQNNIMISQESKEHGRYFISGPKSVFDHPELIDQKFLGQRIPLGDRHLMRSFIAGNSRKTPEAKYYFEDDLSFIKQLMLDDGFTLKEWNDVVDTAPEKIFYDRFNDHTLIE